MNSLHVIHLMPHAVIGLTGMSRNIHSSLADGLNNLRHLIRSITLLAGHAAEIVHHILNSMDIAYHLGHGHSRLIRHGLHGQKTGAALLHPLGHTGSSARNLVDNLLYFLGSLLTLCRQLAYLLSYHGKSLAVLSGTGSLNSSIQCQKIGLAGNATDFLNEIGNLLRGIVQLIDFNHSLLNHAAHVLDGTADLVNLPLVLLHQICRGLALSKAGLGRLRYIAGCRSNLHDPCRCFLQAAGIAFGLGTDIVGQLPQLVQGSLKLADAPYQLLGGKGHLLGKPQHIHLQLRHGNAPGCCR